jgi:hypothetical protein
MLALTLGLFVNLMAMIALPIFQVNFDGKDKVVNVNTTSRTTPATAATPTWRSGPSRRAWTSSGSSTG